MLLFEAYEKKPKVFDGDVPPNAILVHVKCAIIF